MKKELLFSVTKKDFEINYFSGKGAGGQHRNKHQNCVRLRHPKSGASATGQSHRERRSNLREALNNLVKTIQFKLWINQRAWEVIEQETIEEKVEKSMSPKNLKIEEYYNGGWVDADL
jgi:peptide chain release factor 1